MSFAGENSKSAKSIDCALVIAGWPIVYTVARGDYAIPSTAQDSTTLSSANGLTTIHSWANLPDSVGESAKGRPEEGSFTIAQIDVDVLDRYANGGRELSNLLSRQAYLDAAIARLNQVTDAPTTPAGCAATLTASVSTTDTILRVSGSPDITQLSVTGGIVYVGLECIKYTSRSMDGTGWRLDGCTRGYMLTSPNPHFAGATVFSFPPTLFRQRAFLYKGYQNLGLDEWQRGFGGVIVGARKVGAKVTFSIMSTMWLTYADGHQVVAVGSKQSDSSGQPTPYLFRSGTLTHDVLSGDFSNIVIEVDDATNLGNGHYIADVAGHWMAITSTS